VLIGLVLLTLRGEWLLIGYVASSCGLVCLTPWPAQFERYLWPLTPVFAIALLSTLIAIRKHVSPASPRGLRICVLAFLATVVLGVVTIESTVLLKVYQLSDKAFYKDRSGKQHEYRLFFFTPAWQHHDKAVDWLRGQASPQEIVATTTPHWVHLKTGLQSVMPPFERNVHEAQRLMDSVPVSYLIVDNLEPPDVSQRYAAPVVRAFPERWELIYSSAEKDSRIYRRRTETVALHCQGMAGKTGESRFSGCWDWTWDSR
jgi:hypothetical protein